MNKKTDDLFKRLEDGVRGVFDSAAFRNYLSTMSKFHNYSSRNCLLIYMQKPDASHVAGYKSWQTNFKRTVKKGEKGIQIIGYTPQRVTSIQEKKDSSGKPITDNGVPVTEEVVKTIPSFSAMYVFDVSQTDGEPLPKLTNELTGSVSGYSELKEALHKASPYTIAFEEMGEDIKGYCNFEEKRIAIKGGMSEAQTIKTMLHEITHADLHAPASLIDAPGRKDKQTREVEAEAAAYAVCARYGLDTSEYSFPYIAAWSSEKKIPELLSSLENIQAQSADLIDRIDAQLTELKKEKSIEATTPVNERRDEAIDADREGASAQPMGGGEPRPAVKPGITDRIEAAKGKAARRNEGLPEKIKAPTKGQEI